MGKGYNGYDGKPDKKESKKEEEAETKMDGNGEHKSVHQSQPVHAPPVHNLDLNHCYCTGTYLITKIIGSAFGKDIGTVETCTNIGAVLSSIQDPHDLARVDFRLGVALYAAAGVWHLIKEAESWEQ